MRVSKKMAKIALKLCGIAMIMVVALAVGMYDVKAEEPNYLTLEALEDTRVGFNIDQIKPETTDSFQYQIFNGTAWGDWSEVEDPGTENVYITFVELSRGEKIRFKGKNARVHFGGTKGSDGLVLDGYITEGKVKASGDITSLTNEIGGLDKLEETEVYHEIFKGCTGLVSAEELVLPSTKLSENCYSGMFLGCENLESIPKLPATELAGNCYNSMFEDCTKLTVAPELPATTLAECCYQEMFKGCTKLTIAPKLPATTIAEGCYSRMFIGCTSLIAAPELPATIMKSNCYSEMFSDCKSLTTAPELPATTVAENCYSQMFMGCENLKECTKELPATEMKPSCYSNMFSGCKSLTTAPELPATTVAECCFSSMFMGCENLKECTKELPATEMKPGCYSCMFSDCKSLTTAPELPATTVAESCFSSMFMGCENLKECTKELPATTLARNCYSGMFAGCKKLRRIPKLSATILAPNCCCEMFKDCTSITIVPEFPKEMQLAKLCFADMFSGCENLAVIPSIKVSSWEAANGCLGSMFAGCTRLDISETKDENFDRPLRIDGPTEDEYETYYDEEEECLIEYEDIISSLSFMFINCNFDCGVTEYDEEGFMLSKYLLLNKTYYLKTYRHDITIEKSENGTVTVDKSKAAEDEVLKLTVTPAPGYIIDRWEVSEGVEILDDNTFIMPDEDVKIKAIFKKRALTDKDWGDIDDEDRAIIDLDKVTEDTITVTGINDVTYTGQAVNFDLRVYKGKSLLMEGADYTVKYLNNKAAWDGAVSDSADKRPQVVLIGKGAYKGILAKFSQENADELKFNINRINLENNETVAVSDEAALFEAGRKYKPVPTVTLAGKKLKNNADYAVEYLDKDKNTVSEYKETGTYTVKIIGKGNYSGNLYSTYILGNSGEVVLMNTAAVTGIKKSVACTGKAITFDEVKQADFKVSVKINEADTELVLGQDFEVKAVNNKEAGTATLIFSAKEGNKYKLVGEKHVTFKIIGVPLSKTKVVLKLNKEDTAGRKSFDYTGKRIKPVVVLTTKKGTPVELIEGEDYTVKYQKNINAGKATVYIKGEGAYSGKLKKNFKIKPVDFSKAGEAVTAEISAIKKQEDGKYTGTVRVTFNGKLLSEGKDYTISYKNNQAPGVSANGKNAPSVAIKGKGNYSKTKILTFDIVE